MSGNLTKEKEMDIDNLTIRELKQLNQLLKGDDGASQSPYQIGQNYFIRTVTHHYTGKLVRVTPTELILQQAAWIADDGRFYNALVEGKLNEVEPFPADEDVIIGRGAVLDACKWKHALPKDQK